MLDNTTFIIPLRIESPDRLRNIITTTIFLLSHFDAKVMIQEEDTESKFFTQAFPQIEQVVKSKSLIHIFKESNDPTFHRTRILNDMTMAAETEVVVNYDCDILLKPAVYVKAEEMILNGEYDCIYPYGMGNWQYQVRATDELVSNFINMDFDFTVLEKGSSIYDAKYGFCQFFNRQKYIDLGMENENFIAYGYEDDERFYRFSKLAKTVRFESYVYHLEHGRTQNSWFTNPHIQNNKKLWEEISQMKEAELIHYYENVDYMEKRLGQK